MSAVPVLPQARAVPVLPPVRAVRVLPPVRAVPAPAHLVPVHLAQAVPVPVVHGRHRA
jgi:hypothetical protein